jgi:hypothetical protein
MLGASDVMRRAAMKVTAGESLLIELDQFAAGETFRDQSSPFIVRAVAVHNL